MIFDKLEFSLKNTPFKNILNGIFGKLEPTNLIKIKAFFRRKNFFSANLLKMQI
jgi:hypothetical protein